MRRSSAGSDGGRPSLGPLRIKNDGGSATKPRSRVNTGLNNRFSTSGRNSLSNTGGKKTVTMSRLSTVGGGPAAKKRRSSVNRGGYGNDYMKDPRPVSDRGFKERSIRKLVEFLVQEGYPQAISPKLLQSPPSKDFFKIFEFLYSFIEPDFKAGKNGKIEEEIPRLFKQLGYPFNISKSAMFAVGSPHTWPSLLAALSWLREQIEYTKGLDVDQMLFPPSEDSDFESMPENKLLFNYYEDTYLKFMQGADTFEEQEEQLEKQIRQNGLGRDVDHLTQENKKLSGQLAMLEEEPDELLSLKELHTNLEQDEKKLQNYITSLDQHIQHTEHSSLTMHTEKQQLEAELTAVLADNRRKQQIYETQVFTPQDVQRINLERQELQRQIEALETENADWDRQIWDQEMLISKAQEKLESKCVEYNKIAEMLQLIPLNAENAFGIDYELRPTISAIESDKFAANIKPALTQVKSTCRDKVHEVEEKKLGEVEALEQLTELEAEKCEALTQADTKLRRLEETLETKREMQTKESQRLDEEIDSLHSQVAELRLEASSALHDQQNALTQEKARLERLQQARQRESQNFFTYLTQVVTLIVDHKCEIQKHAEEVEKFCEKKLSECQNQARLYDKTAKFDSQQAAADD